MYIHCIWERPINWWFAVMTGTNVVANQDEMLFRKSVKNMVWSGHLQNQLLNTVPSVMDSTQHIKSCKVPYKRKTGGAGKWPPMASSIHSGFLENYDSVTLPSHWMHFCVFQHLWRTVPTDDSLTYPAWSNLSAMAELIAVHCWPRFWSCEMSNADSGFRCGPDHADGFALYPDLFQ